MKNQAWRNWVLRFVSFSFILLTFIGVINYVVDPLWIFGNNGWWNSRRLGFDERRLKTNYLPHIINEIDGIVIGSSMSRTIHTRDFNGLKIYNYSCSSLLPDHAAEFIRHTISEKGGMLEVFIGLDLWNTMHDRQKDTFESSQFYIQNSKQKFKDIFSVDSLKWALKTIERNIKPTTTAPYDEYLFIDNFPTSLVSENLNGINIEERAAKAAVEHLSNYENYTVTSLEKLREVIIDLNIKPVVYITPVTKTYLIKMVELGVYPTYEKFIRDSVNIFGCVWNFMYINSVTVSAEYFYDPNHTNDKGGRAMTQRISGGNDCPADFGILVTKENLEEHIRFLRENIFDALSADCRQL